MTSRAITTGLFIVAFFALAGCEDDASTTTTNAGPGVTASSASGTGGSGGATASSSSAGGAAPCMNNADCDDSDECTDDACNGGMCENTATVCDDGQFCNGMETCDTALGCVAGTAPVIDDGVGCTDDACDEQNDMIVNTPVDANCDDSVGCTDDTCDAVNDCQFTTNNANCNDNVGCTDDTCDAVNDCQFTTNNANCSDNVGCTDDVCDAVNDCQFTANNANCNDSVGCTDDTCDAVNDCQFAANNANCNDSVGCTVDTCDAVNDCQFAPMNSLCNDNVGCTDDTCDAVNDCQFTTNNANCDDNDSCTNDVCVPMIDCQYDTTDPSCVELVITEIMQNPTTVGDTTGEWFEILNLGPYPFTLDGCEIHDDGSNSHIITDPALIAPINGYTTFARSNAPGFTPDYVFTGTLTNSLDEVVLTCSGVEATRVNYDDGALFPDPTGASMTLDPDFETRIDSLYGRNWCEATSSYNGDLGTPGAANDSCPTIFYFDLTQGQEVPPSASLATGLCTATLNAAETQLDVVCNHTVSGPTAAHIHAGAVGVNGGVVFNLGAATSPIVASWSLTPADVTTLLSGGHYVNVHSTASPGGEVRGQILPALTSTHILTGAEEVPAVTTSATGVCVHTFPFGESVLETWCTHSVSAPTAAHIHNAMFGVNGPVVHTLGFATPMLDTSSMSSAQVVELNAGRFYVNVHSTGFPGGELRGQLPAPN